jgi:hypothetical protein
MSVIVIQPTSVVISEGGQVEVFVAWNGGSHTMLFPDHAAMVQFATSGFDGPTEIVRAALSGWAAIDPTCTDTSEFIGRDFHLHFGQDLQGNGAADLHMLWKKGGPT